MKKSMKISLFSFFTINYHQLSKNGFDNTKLTVFQQNGSYIPKTLTLSSIDLYTPSSGHPN